MSKATAVKIKTKNLLSKLCILLISCSQSVTDGQRMRANHNDRFFISAEISTCLAHERGSYSRLI